MRFFREQQAQKQELETVYSKKHNVEKRLFQCATNAEATTKEADKLRARLVELEEDLTFYLGQYRCDCGHPACSRCKDTIYTENLLKKGGG